MGYPTTELHKLLQKILVRFNMLFTVIQTPQLLWMLLFSHNLRPDGSMYLQLRTQKLLLWSKLEAQVLLW